MALPATVRVRLSPEEAGYVSLRPVVVQDMPLRELVDLMLGVTGKNAERICELLRRGALVSGASRFRWSGWEADPADIAALLATFPDAEPARPFTRERCTRVVLYGPACRIAISREAGLRRRFFQKVSFWELLMNLAAGGALEYLDYSYKERADCYRLKLSPAAAATLRNSGNLLRYSSLANQIRSAVVEHIEFYVGR